MSNEYVPIPPDINEALDRLIPDEPDNRWAAFTDEELAELLPVLELDYWGKFWPQWEDEIKAEQQRRKNAT